MQRCVVETITANAKSIFAMLTLILSTRELFDKTVYIAVVIKADSNLATAKDIPSASAISVVIRSAVASCELYFKDQPFFLFDSIFTP
jgi:formyltetrahydrofolate synthetase